MNRPQLVSVPAQPPRAILYLRQSTSHDDSVSLEIQETAGRDYCARRGYVVVAVVSDPSRSGRTFKRRQVVATLEAVERGEADVIVLWKWSRISRKRIDWAIAIDRVESIGGRVESATEPVDVATASGKLQRGMLGEFAAFESDRIGEVWQEIHSRRTKLGLPANGKPRWGYTRVDGPFTLLGADQPTHVKGMFVPDPLTGPVLASLYRRYVAGEAAQHLAEWLRANGHRTSPGYSQQPDGADPTIGGEFDFGSLLRTLDRGFGAGLIRVRDQLAPGAHEPVITREEWQDYLDKRAERRVQPSRAKGSKYPLSGLAYCTRCTRPMYPGLYGAQRSPKYRCETSAKRGRAACQGGYIMATHIENAVKAWLQDHANDVDKRAAVMEVRRARALVAEQDTARIAREVVRIDEALGRLTVDRALNTAGLPDKIYTAAVAELTGRSAQLEAQLAETKIEAHRHAKPDPAVFRGLLAEWDTLPIGTKNDMLRSLIRRVNVTTGRPRGTVKVVPTWEDD